VQFANSPDLASGIMDAIFDAFAPHSVMSKQALDSEKVAHRREGCAAGAGTVV
jgi:type I restriction enzyme R subunit